MDWTAASGPGTLAGVAIGAVRGGRRLFAGLDFALPPGGALVLTGPNGSGKSSLLRLLAGFGRPAAGRFTWDGADIGEEPEAHRARLHYVGHQDALKPALTVDETLRFWRGLAGHGETFTPRALYAFGLATLADLPCRYLSSGQRRRLALSRLAAWPAPLWLLDEPTVGLDAAALAQLAEACRTHRAAGGSIVVSTHQDFDLEDALTASLADFLPTAATTVGW
jgi:heme exporter protein A